MQNKRLEQMFADHKIMVFFGLRRSLRLTIFQSLEDEFVRNLVYFLI